LFNMQIYLLKHGVGRNICANFSVNHRKKFAKKQRFKWILNGHKIIFLTQSKILNKK
jgi:hypothetical protein